MKQYVFFDLEMLCSRERIEFERMESIRLGASKYDLESGKIETFDEYIRPKYPYEITKFCTELTGITQRQVDKAEPFYAVYLDFLIWVGDLEQTKFFAWGKSDLKRIRADEKIHGMKPTHFKHYENFQAVFNEITGIERSIDYGLNLYGLEFEGDKHNPKDDAYNTMRLFFEFNKNTIKNQMLTLKEQYIDKELPDSWLRLAKNIENGDTIEQHQDQIEDIQRQFAQIIEEKLDNELAMFLTHFSNNRMKYKYLKRMKKRVIKIEKKYCQLKEKGLFFEKIDLIEYDDAIKQTKTNINQKIKKSEEYTREQNEQDLSKRMFRPLLVSVKNEDIKKIA